MRVSMPVWRRFQSANKNGVTPLLSGAFGVFVNFDRYVTTSVCPFNAAKWIGVNPSKFVTLGFSVKLAKVLTISRWPFCAALWIGIYPLISFWWQEFSNFRRINCTRRESPSLAAMCNGEWNFSGFAGWKNSKKKNLINVLSNF